MAKITMKLNPTDIARLKQLGAKLETELMSTDGAVYTYLLTIGNGYKEAAISGMGKSFDGAVSLKEFLNTPISTTWKVNTDATRRLKESNHWNLKIWKASGVTEKAVKVFEAKSGNKKVIYAGIDPDKDPVAYEHAERTEFGVEKSGKDKGFDGRALFTLLNAVFSGSTDKIVANIEQKIRESIDKIWR